MKLSGILHFGERGLAIPRFVILIYSVFSLMLAVTILISGLFIHSQWIVVYLGLYAIVALTSYFFAEYAALIAAISAFLTGWMKTTPHGYNVDVGIGLICLAVSIALAKFLFNKKFPANVVSIALLVLAGLVILSSSFTVARVVSFHPIEGFGYQNYAYNAFGFPSDDVLQHVLMMTANLFSWFGIYLLALFFPWAKAGRVRFALLVILLVNFGALLFQQFVDPAFLIPAGFEINWRLNGVTSFCYALGAAAELIFILAPIWFSKRKSGLVISIAVSMLIGYAIILSGSRTAVFTVVVTALTWLIIIMIKRIRENHSLRTSLPYVLMLALLIGGSYIVYEMYPSDPVSAIGRIKTFSQQKGGIWHHIVLLRLRAYPLTLKVIANHPLTGVGIGSYYAEISKQHQFLMPEYQPVEDYEIKSNSSNFYLGLAAELGVFALAIFIVIIIATLFEYRPPPENSKRLKTLFLKASILVYCAGLMLGPQIYNSEAAPWFWILVAAIHCHSMAWTESGMKQNDKNHKKFVWYILPAILLPVTVLAYFQFRTLAALDPFESWKKLRYHLEIGLYKPEHDGRWSSNQAAILLGQGNLALIKWHTGESSQPFETQVRFGIEGEVVRSINAINANYYETVIPLPTHPADKRLFTIQVNPPFIPSNPEDKRTLGIFIQSINVLNAPKEGIGFWDWETLADGKRFRWSKQVSFLPLIEGSKTIRFSLRSLLLPDDSLPVTVTLSIGRKVIRVIKLSPEWQKVELDVNDLATKDEGIQLLRFEADHSYRPSELGLSDDTRDIAFAITDVQATKN